MATIEAHTESDDRVGNAAFETEALSDLSVNSDAFITITLGLARFEVGRVTER